MEIRAFAPPSALRPARRATPAPARPEPSGQPCPEKLATAAIHNLAWTLLHGHELQLPEADGR